MLDKLKAKIFPCETRMKEAMTSHNDAVAQNKHAHERLMAVCEGRGRKAENSREYKKPDRRRSFPPLTEGHVVNPR